MIRSTPILLPKRKTWGKCHTCRVGARVKDSKWRHKPAFPSIIVGNIRPLASNMDELTALVNAQQEPLVSSLHCSTAAWLQSHILDHSVTMPDFLTV